MKQRAQVKRDAVEEHAGIRVCTKTPYVTVRNEFQNGGVFGRFFVPVANGNFHRKIRTYIKWWVDVYKVDAALKFMKERRHYDFVVSPYQAIAKIVPMSPYFIE